MDNQPRFYGKSQDGADKIVRSQNQYTKLVNDATILQFSIIISLTSEDS